MARGCCLFECSGTPTAYYPQIRLQPCAFFLLLTAIFGLRVGKQRIHMRSSVYLWHYTTSIASVKNILKNGFDLSRCTKIGEGVPYLRNDHDQISITRVCFTNVSPLDVDKVHIDKYGEYCIGFKREWINSQNINPVIYCTKDGILTKLLKPIVQTNITLYKLCKQYSDYNSENAIIDDRFPNTLDHLRYYDEHEWRYITDESNGSLTFETHDVFEIWVKNEADKEEILKDIDLSQYSEIIRFKQH